METRPDVSALLKSDANVNFKAVYNAVISPMKQRKDLTVDVERRLARSQWDHPSMKWAKRAACAERRRGWEPLAVRAL